MPKKEIPSGLRTLVRTLTWLSVIAAAISSFLTIRSVFIDEHEQELSLELQGSIDIAQRHMKSMNRRAAELSNEFAKIQDRNNGWDIGKRLHACQDLVTVILYSYGKMIPAKDHKDLETALEKLKDSIDGELDKPRIVEAAFHKNLDRNKIRIEQAIQDWNPIEKTAGLFLAAAQAFRDGQSEVLDVQAKYGAFDDAFENRLALLDSDDNAPRVYIDCEKVLLKTETLSNYQRRQRWPVRNVALAIGLVVGAVLLGLFGAGWVPGVPKDD